MNTPIYVEQVNVSDDEYQLVDLLVSNGEEVSKGQPLFSYESSKSINEVEATQDGFVYLNNIEEGKYYQVGHLLAQITSDVLVEFDALFESDISGKTKNLDNHINGMLFSDKALKMIEKKGLKPDDFQGLDIIQSKDVLEKFSNKKHAELNDLSNFSSVSKGSRILRQSKRLAVIGAGKAAFQLYECIYESKSFEVVRFYDSGNRNLNTLFDVPVHYGDILEMVCRDFKENKFDECIISFSGNIEARAQVFKDLSKAGIKFCNVIHPSATISKFADLGVGNLILANVRIGPFTNLGDNNVLSANCSVEHHNSIGDHNTYGPGVLYSGSCYTGSYNKFGTMIGIEPNVKIGDHNIIASSLVVTNSIPDRKLIRSKANLDIVDIKGE